MEGSLRNSVLEYLSIGYHQLQWCSLRELGQRVGIKCDLEGVAPHEVHLQPCFEEFVHGIRVEDGLTFDIRVNFAGFQDAVTLRRDITASISSVPALMWQNLSRPLAKDIRRNRRK